jgi:hypothetical protein
MSKSTKEKKAKTNSKANKEIKIKYFDIGNWKTILFIFLCVLVVWTFGSLIVYKRYLNGQEHAGQLGDSYGWLTSLFTALAFAGLLYTILLQRKELKETKEEFKKQNTTLTRQRFETTFFNMLSFHFKITETVQYQALGNPPTNYIFFGSNFWS